MNKMNFVIKAGELISPDFKTQLSFNKQDSIKLDYHISQTEQSSKIDLHIYGQMMCDKVAKAIPWRKDSLFRKLFLQQI